MVVGTPNPNYWQDRLFDGSIYIYTGVNDHDGQVTVSVHDGPDVNDTEIIEWLPANGLIEDGFFSGPVGSRRFKESVAKYMDHLGVKRPRKGAHERALRREIGLREKQRLRSE